MTSALQTQSALPDRNAVEAQTAFETPHALEIPKKTPPEKNAGEAKPSPMIAQYLEIKANNPVGLLFYRMGDFYELFFEDSEIAARALGIVLTKRGKHLGEDIPMCGVPVDRHNEYLQRLIALGHCVAICEQLEDPAEARKRGAKSVVKRDVVRLVTPGTITEERLLEPGHAHFLAAVARVKMAEDHALFGVAAVDISTGDFFVYETDLAGLASTLSRIEPREIVAADALVNDPAIRQALENFGAPLAPTSLDSSQDLRQDSRKNISSERRLCDFFGLAVIDGFGGLSRAEIAAAAAAVHYIERTQLGARPALSRPKKIARGAIMEIDAATRANLELTRTLAGDRSGSLLSSIDRTVTPAGARLLAERLAAPLTDVAAINGRLDSAAFFIAADDLRKDIRALLRSAPDLTRAVSRLSLGRGGPRDMGVVRDGVSVAFSVAALLAQRPDAPNDVLALLPDLQGVDSALAPKLGAALADDLKLDKRDGDFIRRGFDPALDEMFALRDNSRELVSELHPRYAKLAGLERVKIKYNNFIGYYIEVSSAHGEKMLRPPYNETFIHRQTMAGAMRFSTAELADFATRIASAADQALTQALQHFDALANLILAESDALKSVSKALASLDVMTALAETADALRWTRPVIDDNLDFHIVGGRHPVVEAALKARGDAFIPNDCDLSGEKAGAIAVITGPNMAGKSTFLRQNALIAVLAQMGCYVPASAARIGVVDRLFSRVGASDDLARGRSTFMVEMVETAAILNQATRRSLVILDEIGRGTATFDGLSIAWASMEHLHDSNCARALFATHFHELTQLGQRLVRLKNITMRVTDFGGKIVFLHEVVDGAADRSYGVQVAKLAGLPESVVQRAKDILAELEASNRHAPVEKMIADLPLFAARADIAPDASRRNRGAQTKQTPFVQEAPAAQPEKPDLLRERLAMLDPDDLSPREALAALYELRKLAL